MSRVLKIREELSIKLSCFLVSLFKNPMQKIGSGFILAICLLSARFKEIMICNMDRQESDPDYVKETIKLKADFIQLRQPISPSLPEHVKMLKANGIRVNFFGTDSPEEIRKLFEYGVDFPMVNDILRSIHVASAIGIQPV